MAFVLNKVALRIKNDDGSYNTSNIIPTCSDDGIKAFAEAYNSLQRTTAESFIKKSEYQVVL